MGLRRITRPAGIGILACAGAVVCALAVAAAGCARARRVGEALNPGPSAAVRPTESRIDVVLGQTLVLPVALDGAVNPARELKVRLDDGRPLGARLYWISVRPDSVEPSWGWLAPVGRWDATPAQSATRPSSSGFWTLVMDLPLNAVGQGVWIGSSRIVLNWLPDPAMVRAGTNEGPWRRPVGGALGPRLLEYAAIEARSPTRRWRQRLLLGGLTPDEGPGPQGRFDDPVLEALALQNDSRWRVALAMLWGADAELCERVKGRLAGVVDFGGGQLAPAWPGNEADLSILLSDLLSPRLHATGRAERAAAWLETLPPALGWVIDDAGLRDAESGRPVSTLGLANLTERATLAWASTGPDQPAPDLVNLPAREVRQLSVVGQARSEAARSGDALAVTLHAGRWSAPRVAAPQPLRAVPPGIRIASLAGDWTLAALLAGAPDQSMTGDLAWATAGLLHRAPEGTDRWYLYLECARPEGEQRRETVRIWLGPYGAPKAVLSVSSDGALVDEAVGAPAPDRASISGAAGKWSLRVPLPSRAIEPGGILRIAVERTDARGRRSAWPRPMLPWQAEPGRIAVDLAAWGDLARPTPASATR